jgi:hypothetical protein
LRVITVREPDEIEELSLGTGYRRYRNIACSNNRASLR